MSIHVCKCIRDGLEEYHLRYPGMSQEAAQELADKINGGWLEGQTAAIEQRDRRIAELEAELAHLCDAALATTGGLRRRIAELEAELERERMRLAACGVVALADTPESAIEARQMNVEYRSGSCDDVARRVDECIALRAERVALRAALDRIAHHGPQMLARGEYRQGALDALESVRKIATAALAAKG